jgi:N-methylhydantoinase A/oxoprolinase/acetone carboxylase beta subunit
MTIRRKGIPLDDAVHVAIDIGGTFTDVVGASRAGIAAIKVPSQHDDPIAAVRHGIAALADACGFDPGAVTRFVHGTTVATNAVLTRRGARIGLLATAGFEDVLEIGRQKRSRMYDLFQPPETPVFLAPRRRRVGIAERIAADGSVTTPLDETGVRRAVALLVEEHQIEALAVCYLFSFRNPRHELRTREIAADAAPGLPVSLSCEVDPVFREYERSCVTAFDAYVRPVMSGYVARLAAGLAGAGIRAPVEVMQSRGAIAGAARILERPVVSLLSGPAAGALGGALVGQQAGHPDCVTLDMGGTSTDIAVIHGGRLIATREGRIGGFPLRVQMVDVHTIGAGGGSIARLDDGGALRVGPESAEADPGPACYDRGGVLPTVTDASLVLGLMHPSSFAGGIRLDPVRAEASMQSIAARLGTSQRAAHGILTVCNEAMAEAIRAVTIGRGIDPRGFALVAFGGAGPVHAGRVAEALGMRTVVVPPRPGVLAAEGLLAAPIEEERNATFFRPATTDAAPALRQTLDRLAEEAGRRLGGSATEDGSYTRFTADMRYAGQAYEVEVAIDPADADLVAATVARFHDVYRSAYGQTRPAEPVEFVNLRAVVGRRPPILPSRVSRLSPTRAASSQSRAVWFSPSDGPTETPVLARTGLAVGTKIVGPAIIEQSDTTTVMYPGHACEVHASGALILTMGARS